MKNNKFYEELKQLVAFKSVSSDPAYRKNILACAAYLKRRLEKTGATVKLIGTRGYPLVAGRIERNKAWPTVAIYNHYDVQPITEPEKWNSDPFVLKAAGGKYFGRGASDNKGNLVICLLAVEKALSRNLPLNFEFIYEGEEESCSRNFREGIFKARKHLNPDSIIVADSGWFSRNQPSIVYGMRGVIYMHWNIRTGAHAVHSGELGGVARNPLEELMAAAAKCHDPKTGRILIPGIYKNVRKPGREEIRNWLKVDVSADALRRTHNLKGLRVKGKAALLKTIWALPTFEVHGCVGGYMKKNGVMTVIPPDGQLLVSMRLVPDQEPDEIFKIVKKHVAGLNPDIEIRLAVAAKPYLGDYKSKEVKAASRVLEKCFGLPAIKARMGGSVGAVAHMRDAFGKAQIFCMSFGLPEYGIHGPNEYFEKKQAEKGIEALFAYLEMLSK